MKVVHSEHVRWIMTVVGCKIARVTAMHMTHHLAVTSDTPCGEPCNVMGLGARHVLSTLDPSDLSIVRVRCAENGLWKHILTKMLRCGQPNPVRRMLR